MILMNLVMVVKVMNKTVNILGTEYTIKTVKISECEYLKEKHWCGCCNGTTKTILIGDASEEEYFDKLSPEEQDVVTKDTIRHEIIHAFLNESGLQDSSMQYCNAWAKNEEMIDWMALQFPKIQKVFVELGCDK